MTNFKKGDKVRYIGTEVKYLSNSVLTVANVTSDGRLVYFAEDGFPLPAYWNDIELVPKFKVGDKVRYVGAHSDEWDYDTIYRVAVVDTLNNAIHLDNHAWSMNVESFELVKEDTVPKFKSGDKVRYIGTGSDLKGKILTVEHVFNNGIVWFDEPKDRTSTINDIELVTEDTMPKFKKGDKVRYIDSGTILTVGNVSSDGRLVHFTETSFPAPSYADDLELVTDSETLPVVESVRLAKQILKTVDLLDEVLDVYSYTSKRAIKKAAEGNEFNRSFFLRLAKLDNVPEEVWAIVSELVAED